MTDAFVETDRRLGAHVTALIGVRGGAYPAGNSVLIEGADATAIVDPSTSIVIRGGAPRPVDRVLLTHVHEDHVAGVHLFPQASVEVHEADLLGIQSLDGLMSIYGLPPESDDALREIVVRDFSYVARPDATGFAADEVIDLGGVTVTVVHLPGHTRGHSGLLIEPDGVFITGDIDLSTFGPYYGDAWSSIDDFETSLRRAREIDAHHYVTFHHKGVIDGRDDYVAAIDTFAAVIGTREQRMVDYMADPRSLEDLVAHRFVYRPHVDLPWVAPAERRSAEMSLVRLLAAGRIVDAGDGLYRAA